MRSSPWSALVLGLGLACASPSDPLPAPPLPELFTAPLSDDPFTPRIRLWQTSERWEALRRRSSDELAVPGSLELEYQAFQSSQKQRIARDTLRWIQSRSPRLFRSDNGRDYWPTLEEMFARGRDDCDGLELLSFTLLRKLGFGEGELYRAILRSSDGARYHMVTLWFDARPGDPFVIDPTGWVSRELVRLSSLTSWLALRLFDEDEQFAVEQSASRSPGP